MKFLLNSLVIVCCVLFLKPMASETTNDVQPCSGNESYWETWAKNAEARTHSSSPVWETTGLAVSPDGSMLAVVTSDNLSIHDTQSLQSLKILESGINWDTFKQYSLSWSPDNSLLAVARYIYTLEIPDPKSGIQIWDVATGELLGLLPSESEIIAWSQDDQLIAIADLYGVITVWDAETQSQVYLYDAYHLDSAVNDSLAWSSNNLLAITANNAGILYVWDVKDQDKPTIFQINSGSFLTWSPDGSRLAIGSWANSIIQIWDASKEDIIATLEGSQGNPFDLQWSPNGDSLARGTQSGLYIWDLNTENASNPRRLDEKMPEFVRIAWMPNGENLFSVTFDGTIYKWDVMDGCVLASLPTLDRSPAQYAF